MSLKKFFWKKTKKFKIAKIINLLKLGELFTKKKRKRPSRFIKKRKKVI